MILLMVAPLSLLNMVSMALVLWAVGAILRDEYGIQRQNYIALLL